MVIAKNIAKKVIDLFIEKPEVKKVRDPPNIKIYAFSFKAKTTVTKKPYIL